MVTSVATHCLYGIENYRISSMNNSGLVVINKSPTICDRRANLVIRDRIGKVLEQATKDL